MTRYPSKTVWQALAKLVEEAGEVVAAGGKTFRFGPNSVNPELKEGDKHFQETNEAWLLREIQDLKAAIQDFEVILRIANEIDLKHTSNQPYHEAIR